MCEESHREWRVRVWKIVVEVKEDSEEEWTVIDESGSVKDP